MHETPKVVREARNKRLAVFLDGTWNVVGDDTNVWRMKSLCAPADAQGIAQLVLYEKGVSGLTGGLTGDGIDDNITDAYQWLVDHYDPATIFSSSAFRAAPIPRGVLPASSPHRVCSNPAGRSASNSSTSATAPVAPAPSTNCSMRNSMARSATPRS